MNKMAVIGDGDSVLAFKAAGIEAFNTTDSGQVEKLIKKLAKEYKIIFITDVLAKSNSEVIEKYVAQSYPIIIPIPSKEGSNGYGMNLLKSAMDKALGVDILFNDDKE